MRGATLDAQNGMTPAENVVPLAPAERVTSRDEAIARIRAALRSRSGKAWSVKSGRGTASGWVTITAPPRRLREFGCLTPEDAEELRKLLGVSNVHHQGVKVPASYDYYTEYVQRAEGTTPTTLGTPYWD